MLIAAVAFAVLSGLAVVIFRGMGARNLLESKNDCERTINVLFSNLRGYDSFGAAIDALPVLHEKILGISAFGRSRELLYTWGNAPDGYPSVRFAGKAATGLMKEMYIADPKESAQIVLVQPVRPPGPPPGGDPGKPPELHHETSSSALLFRQADLFYFKIKQPQYWRTRRVQALLFPLSELLLLLLVGFVWVLFTKNAQYRQEAERQKSLVVLGTAASTLAHEIKNPLMSIRLQAEILSRMFAGSGEQELGIIVDEVERLSQLSTRVNDVLRDPAGNPTEIDPFEIVSEIGLRVSGRDIASTEVAAGTVSRVRIDTERLRSIVENLLRNALESGGPPDEVAIAVGVEDAQLHIDVLDRGPGLPVEGRETAFDPFFTTKSRGTGIGLAICRRFARAAGGEVSLEGRPGGGLRARLSLPRIGV